MKKTRQSVPSATVTEGQDRVRLDAARSRRWLPPDDGQAACLTQRHIGRSANVGKSTEIPIGQLRYLSVSQCGGREQKYEFSKVEG